MDKMDVMIRFFKMIEGSNLMTVFIKNIFGYEDINDYNYMFRMFDDGGKIIIDIYDNFTINRFNRYVFNFLDCDYVVLEQKEDFVFVKFMSVLNINDGDDNLYKLAYLFNLDNDRMLEYANTFLDIKFIDILKKII